MPIGRRVAIAVVLAVVVTAAAVVAEWMAAILLTPTCTHGPARPAVLGTCIGLTLLAPLAPAGVIGIRARPLLAVALGAATAVAPATVLLHFATTTLSGFCF
jgi:hypothetical protein